MDVVTNIKEKYPSMTRKQRSIADFMLEHPEEMSFITLKDLSEETDVSEMTILNTCNVLGYKNFNELKYEFRKYLSILCKVNVQTEGRYASPGVPDRELEDMHNLLLQVCQEEFDMIKNFFSSINLEEIFKAAQMILSAKTVVICGFGVSRNIADYFSMRLALMGIPSVIVNTESNDSIHSSLPMFDENTLVIPIVFPDYYVMTVKVAEYAKHKKAPILTLTDSMKSPVAEISDLTLLSQTTTRLFLNTITLPMMMVNFITTAVNIEKSTNPSKKPSAPDEFAQFFSPENSE